MTDTLPTVTSARPPARTLRRARADMEFLPAALEILERPPSPVGIWLLRLICAFAVLAFAWSWFGRVDVVAIAQGKVQPVGRVKIIQPLETGKVSEILVSNGSHVNAGDVLAELDHTSAVADETALMDGLASARAEELRRGAAIAAARSGSLTPTQINWPADIPERIATREMSVLQSDLKQLSASVRALEGQRILKQAEKTRLSATIVAQQTLIDTVHERVDMRAATAKSGSGSRAALIDALESLQVQETQLVTQKGQLGETDAALESLPREIEKTIEGFIGDNSQKRADASRRADELQQKLAHARVDTANRTLRSPIAGRVQALSLTTVGQVVGPGESVMHIVPDDQGVEIEAYLRNADIGFVNTQQDAVIKVDAFPFTRYGVIPAHVRQVATDAIPEPDAQQMESAPGTSPRSRSFGGAERVQNLVFPVTLQPEKSVIETEGGHVPLSPGMTVTVEIKTGNRRLIDYLLSPITETVSQAARER